MLKIDIITIFPKLFEPYFSESLIKKAIERKLLKVKAHDLRNWAKDKRKTVDDRPFGGGLGMVLMVEPIFRAVKKIKKGKKPRVILFTPRGKKFTQKEAKRLLKYDQLVLVCGRYEGVDERVAKHIADEELSVGDYVLMGGEVAAMAVIETMTRLIPGVIGKPEFLKERITKNGFLEYAEYTRPEVFNPEKGKKWSVPKVLLSGDHKDINQWKIEHGKEIV